jgi:AraC-like DNA-binding protein
MPLFMDIHTVDSDNFSAEDVVKAHMEDLSVQDRFGVKQIKYWVNVPARTLFCLMEGPNKEACNEVHAQSHGQTACNIIEVNDDEFKLFLGEGTKDETDLAQHSTGEIDTGYRSLLAVHTLDLSRNVSTVNSKIISCIESFKGKTLPLPRNLMASFVYATDALNCIQGIRHILNQHDQSCEYRIALFTGRPVDEVGKDLFAKTKRRLEQVCAFGYTNSIYVDSDSLELSKKEALESELSMDAVNVLNKGACLFLDSLFKVLNSEWKNSEFKSETMHSAIGLSKSQFYRKIKSITGFSPNQLIQELRLRNAALDLRSGALSVSQVAYDSGFNSPTYFSRSFKSRFGILPKHYAKLHS